MAATRDRIQHAADHRFDPRPHVLDPARGEGFYHEVAQPCVLRRIGLQDGLRHVVEDRLTHDVGSVAALAALDEILAEALIAQHQADLLVAADHEGAERRQMHRIDRAQPRVMRVGIPDEIRRKRIEKGAGRFIVHVLFHDSSSRSFV